MSDNRKYYYLKLKENYFDEDASHNKYLPFFVDRFCLLILLFIKTSLLSTATFSRFRNQKSDGPFDSLYYLNLLA